MVEIFVDIVNKDSEELSQSDRSAIATALKEVSYRLAVAVWNNRDPEERKRIVENFSKKNRKGLAENSRRR